MPLGALLEEAGLRDDAVEVLFTGLDRGIEGGVEQDYERSLPVAEALGADALLAYEMGGAPLPPQHGYPLRLVVAGWYGMAHVKWLRAITAITEPFEGYQQAVGYRMYDADGNAGAPVTRMMPRSLTIPPGIPDFLTRARVLDAGPCSSRAARGRAGRRCERVEVSVDGGESWADAQLGARARRARVARLVVGVGRQRAGRVRDLLAGHRRRRQRPAGRGALEPQGLRQQRGRADPGHGARPP